MSQYWFALNMPFHAKLPQELLDETSLLNYLGVSAGELKKIWWYRGAMYHSFSISKGNGARLISAPDERLKFLQRKIARLLSGLYRVRNPVHGFVPDRSVSTNANSHLHRRHVVNLDLKDFFPSITENRVYGMLASLGIEIRVAEIISRVCCLNSHLPQGAPSSPLLSNMICFRLDKRLMVIAKGARCIYTRYADDITFSSHQPPTSLFQSALPSSGRFAPAVLAPNLTGAIEGNGFTIHPDKAHYADRHSRRVVTGITINEFLNVDRRFVRNIRATLYSVETLGVQAAETKFHTVHRGRCSLSAHLEGKISWLTHIKGQSDPVVRSLTMRFNKCFPSRRLKVSPTDEEMRNRAVWIVEHSDQGTAFFLKDVGLVTAAHCVNGVDEVEIYHPSKHANKFTARVVKRCEHRDLAILDHQIPDTEYFEFTGATRAVAVGDAMVALGYPSWGPGDALNVRPGVVSTLTVKSAVKLIEVTQKLAQGMSGGPLLDRDGAVAGIIHKGGPEEARDFAVHIDVLADWVEGTAAP